MKKQNTDSSEKTQQETTQQHFQKKVIRMQQITETEVLVTLIQEERQLTQKQKEEIRKCFLEEDSLPDVEVEDKELPSSAEDTKSKADRFISLCHASKRRRSWFVI